MDESGCTGFSVIHRVSFVLCQALANYGLDCREMLNFHKISRHLVLMQSVFVLVFTAPFDLPLCLRVDDPLLTSPA